MNLTSFKTIKQILAQHGIKPSKWLGQNFLVDRNAVKKLMAAAEIGPRDVVLEIGPGIGALTQELAQCAKKVIAVEKDNNLVRALEGLTVGMKNVEVIHADILKVNLSGIPTLQHSYKVVANLPYYITAPVIRKFLELCEAKPSTITLLVQKEVGQRMCARPPDMNIFAVSVQVYAAPKIIRYIKKGAFWPQPKVDAAIVHIVPFPQAYPLAFPKFFTVVKAGFKQPRRQLVNNLSGGFGIPKNQVEQWLLAHDIQPSRRAETLSLQDWINLANML